MHDDINKLTDPNTSIAIQESETGAKESKKSVRFALAESGQGVDKVQTEDLNPYETYMRHYSSSVNTAMQHRQNGYVTKLSLALPNGKTIEISEQEVLRFNHIIRQAIQTQAKGAALEFNLQLAPSKDHIFQFTKLLKGKEYKGDIHWTTKFADYLLLFCGEIRGEINIGACLSIKVNFDGSTRWAEERLKAHFLDASDAFNPMTASDIFLLIAEQLLDYKGDEFAITALLKKQVAYFRSKTKAMSRDDFYMFGDDGKVIPIELSVGRGYIDAIGKLTYQNFIVILELLSYFDIYPVVHRHEDDYRIHKIHAPKLYKAVCWQEQVPNILTLVKAALSHIKTPEAQSKLIQLQMKFNQPIYRSDINALESEGTCLRVEEVEDTRFIDSLSEPSLQKSLVYLYQHHPDKYIELIKICENNDDASSDKDVVIDFGPAINGALILNGVVSTDNTLSTTMRTAILASVTRSDNASVQCMPKSLISVDASAKPETNDEMDLLRGKLVAYITEKLEKVRIKEGSNSQSLTRRAKATASTIFSHASVWKKGAPTDEACLEAGRALYFGLTDVSADFTPHLPAINHSKKRLRPMYEQIMSLRSGDRLAIKTGKP